MYKRFKRALSLTAVAAAITGQMLTGALGNMTVFAAEDKEAAVYGDAEEMLQDGTEEQEQDSTEDAETPEQAPTEETTETTEIPDREEDTDVPEQAPTEETTETTEEPDREEDETTEETDETPEETEEADLKDVLVETNDPRDISELVADNWDDVEKAENSESSVSGTDNEFELKRIVLEADEITETYGATDIIHYGEYDEYVFQFETVEDTEIAYGELVEDFGSDYVFTDQIVSSLDMADFEGADYDRNIVADCQIQSYSARSWGVTYMGMNYLKDQYSGSGITKTVKVAVVDSGLDTRNSIFNGRVDTSNSYDFIKNSSRLIDENGHGTHVAGTICDATPGNVKVISCRAFDYKGRATSVTLLSAFQYAVNKKPDVINCSFGCQDNGRTNFLDAAIQKAYNNKTVVCVAAGNDNESTSYSYPANNKNVITVSSIGKSGYISYFSNYGTHVDFCAPGEAVIAAYKGGGTKALDGTSMATPHISAACAYVKMVKNAPSVSDVKDTLKKYSVDLGAKGRDNYYGYGYPYMKNFFRDNLKAPATEAQAPTLKGAVNTSAGLEIRYGAVSGASYYKVYRKYGSGSWNYVGNSKTTTYTDKTAAVNTTYRYTVRAVVNGKQGKYNTTGIAAKRILQPTVKTINYIAGISVEWSKTAGATGYKVYRRVAGTSNWSLLGTVGKDATKYADKNASTGVVYEYTVRTIAGSVMSAYDKTSSICRLVPATVSSLENEASKTFKVTWNKVNGVSGYIIQYSTSENFSSYKEMKISNANITSVNISNCNWLSRYYVRVKTYKTIGGRTYTSGNGVIKSAYMFWY